MVSLSLKRAEGKFIPEDALEGLEGERQAVIVGINEYSDPKIPKLDGAVNDAKDVCDRLKDFGNFKVAKDHFLTDEQATCKAIRNAIYDIICETDPCDLTIFYFSGHGFADSKGNGYLAPYDMMKYKPSVCGIKMQELKQDILDSFNKPTVLMILDCCYSGISTKGTKSIPANKASFDTYFGNLNGETRGEGKIILASSEEDKVSREIIDCTHITEKTPHPHGIFTYHFIEGIDGKASEEDGIIYFDKLRDHVEKQLIEIGKQKPKFFAADSSRISTIKIAVAPKKYTEYVSNKIIEAESFYCNDDLPSLICAVDIVKKILNITKKKEAQELQIKIIETLDKYQESASGWLTINEVEIRPYLSKNFTEIQKIVEEYFNYGMITNLDRIKIAKLIALCNASRGEIDTHQFITKIKQVEQLATQPSISKLNVGVPK